MLIIIKSEICANLSLSFLRRFDISNPFLLDPLERAVIKIILLLTEIAKVPSNGSSQSRYSHLLLHVTHNRQQQLETRSRAAFYATHDFTLLCAKDDKSTF